MTPIRSSTLDARSDLYTNQTSNGVYPVRPQSHVAEPNFFVGRQVTFPTLCYSLRLEIEV